MKNFNLMQIIPSLISGGAEQGTIDLANKLADNMNNNWIISNGGEMIKYLNKKYVNHYNLSVHSKNFIFMPFVARKINESKIKSGTPSVKKVARNINESKIKRGTPSVRKARIKARSKEGRPQ